jgi:hypothetical protein
MELGPRQYFGLADTNQPHLVSRKSLDGQDEEEREVGLLGREAELLNKFLELLVADVAGRGRSLAELVQSLAHQLVVVDVCLVHLQIARLIIINVKRDIIIIIIIIITHQFRSATIDSKFSKDDYLIEL